MKALSGSFSEKIKYSYDGGCDIILYCSGKLKEMQNIYQHVKPIKKKYFNYFLEDSYRIKKKVINIKKIKDQLIKNNLIFL